MRIAVTREVPGASVDGRAVPVRFEAGVNRALAIVDVPRGTRNTIALELAGEPLRAAYQPESAVGAAFRVTVEGAESVELLDPQQVFASPRVKGNVLEAVVARAGRRTAFVKATRGRLALYLPLDLRAGEAVEIREPRVDWESLTLQFELENRTAQSAQAIVRFGGESHAVQLSETPTPAGTARTVVKIALSERALRAVTPGSNPIEVEIRRYRQNFIMWDLPASSNQRWLARADLLDMAWDYHEEAASLFNTKFYYDAWQMGIDYPVLPPATYEWGGHRIDNPKLTSPRFLAAERIPFYLANERKLGGVYQGTEGGGPRNVLPVANWRPGLYPSNIVIPVNGSKLAKAYFLAYSWQRGHKTYHPNVELIANYVDGGREVRQLIPPYSFMPQYGLTSVSRNPYRVEVIPSGLSLGKEKDVEWYLARKEKTGEQADIYDLPLDTARGVKSIEVRSVATESIFAIFAVTLVRAE